MNNNKVVPKDFLIKIVIKNHIKIGRDRLL